MLLFFIIVCALTSANAIRNWDYSLIGVEADIKVDYFHNDLRAVRVKRGEYGINGSFTLDKDLGPDNKFQGNTFRSPRGNDDFKPTPFKMPKRDLNDFFNHLYKDVMMEDLHKCANTPYFEGEWEGVVKAGKYEYNMCMFNVGNYPDNMLAGVYKIEMELLDEQDNSLIVYTFTVDIETTLGGFGK